MYYHRGGNCANNSHENEKLPNICVVGGCSNVANIGDGGGGEVDDMFWEAKIFKIARRKTFSRKFSTFSADKSFFLNFAIPPRQGPLPASWAPRTPPVGTALIATFARNIPGTKYKSEKYLNALQHFAQINPRARSAGKHQIQILISNFSLFGKIIL